MNSLFLALFNNRKRRIHIRRFKFFFGAPMKISLWALSFFLLLNANPASAQEQAVSCGIASGFPPYQFVLAGEPTGFDVDVARAVCARLGLQISFAQAEW